jgi:hypothetical protein
MISLLITLLQAPPAAPAKAHAYISEFCAPITLQEPDTGRLRQHYGDWGAHPASDEQARPYRPQDAEAAGQMVTFDDKDAPHIFVERRTGTCSLIYPQAHTPAVALEDLKTSTLPINGARAQPVSWRLVITKRFGRPGPIRYFLPVGEDGGRFGLCATLFEDLRLNDATPATMVRVTTCRLSGDETLDNG